MKLTVQQVFDSTRLIRTIIDSNRALPARGAFLLGRMFNKLKPEFDHIEVQRDALITAYEFKASPDAPNSVPPGKMTEFNHKWGGMAELELEVDVQPISIKAFGEAIFSVGELLTLGDLVTE